MAVGDARNLIEVIADAVELSEDAVIVAWGRFAHLGAPKKLAQVCTLGEATAPDVALEFLVLHGIEAYFDLNFAPSHLAPPFPPVAACESRMP